tara:strand:- start:106 stop:1095 length:990 start_codon:yes stop_codon:yes gene_type:complete
MIVNVILSGGVGSRLWPLSNKKRPKQYLNLFSNKSLFELTVLRNSSVTQSVLLVGNEKSVKLGEQILEDIKIEYNTIIESIPRNTSAAIAFAALESNPEDILVVTPADHLIEEQLLYEKCINEAIELAKDNFIVTFGITPLKPETGFGYIEYTENDVTSFREKPSLEQADLFFKSGKFLWNSGIFCFKASVFLDELKKLDSEIYSSSLIAKRNSISNKINHNLSEKIPAVSIDYSVMEKSKIIKVVKSDFTWNDMGSFESLYEYYLSIGHKVDEHGNMIIGNANPTFFIGLKNVIAIFDDGANLILSKNSSQEVKSLYNDLECSNSNLI